MKCISAIDIPLLTAVACATPYQTCQMLQEVMGILGELQAAKAFVLFNEELYIALSTKISVPELFWEVLSKTKFETYTRDANAAIVKVAPDITAGWTPPVVTKMESQIVALHKQPKDADTVYVIDRIRGFQNCSILETLIKSSTRQHDLLNVSDSKDVKAYFDKYSPKLVQLKHGSQPYTLGGKRVSPFSAYNANDTSYAEMLLKRAMDDYQGVYSHRTPPDTLFTWDATNKCYVCFHHSGRWEYHGHDLQTPYHSVPDYIKNKYHIWK